MDLELPPFVRLVMILILFTEKKNIADQQKPETVIILRYFSHIRIESVARILCFLVVSTGLKRSPLCLT